MNKVVDKTTEEAEVVVDFEHNFRLHTKIPTGRVVGKMTKEVLVCLKTKNYFCERPHLRLTKG
jgi:hypothetical protein